MEINVFDASILAFFNQFAHQSFTFDKVVLMVADSNLLKGGVVLSVYAGLWFRRSGDVDAVRLKLLAGLFGSFFGLFVARALALTLPFRTRPIHADLEGFVVPYGVERKLDGWSSFPSDHGTMFFALATGLVLASRRVGWIVVAYMAVVIASTRVYLGLHYPTDILFGALVGVALAWVAERDYIRSHLSCLLVLERRRPHLFYAVAALVICEMSALFDPTRNLAEMAFGIARHTVRVLGG